MKKIKNITLTFVFAAIIFLVSAICFVKPAESYSDSERRALAQMPELSVETVSNGSFMDGFEEYSADQFPFRDELRSVKTIFATKVLRKLDNNGLFMAEGHISKIDDAENEYMLDYAAERFRYIKDTFIKDENTNIYFSVVPDKNFVLAPENGYPSLDYDSFIQKMRDRTEYMQYIDITDLLSADDYYTTDTHWRQEKITDVAKRLAETMGTKIKGGYKVNTLDNPFYGVYTGQLALRLFPDVINYLTNDIIDGCKVTYYDTGMPEEGDMYNMEKAYGKDPYEMFLSGSAPLVTIENPYAETDKELVMFRDSFGSSLAPLMAEGYKKITVVDIRYIQSSFVGNFVNFDNCDVLFIYSTALLNNSTAMR